MKKGKTNLAVVFLLMICILLLGAVIALLYYSTRGADANIIYKVLLYAGIVLMVLIFATLFSYLNVSRKSGKVKKKKKAHAPIREDEYEDDYEEEERRPAKSSKKSKKDAKRARERRRQAEAAERTRQRPAQDERRSQPPREREESRQRPQRAEHAPKRQAEVMPDAEVQLDNSTTYNGSTVSYMPSKEAYAKAASAGRVQSIDEKFEQIGKMGKAQFVVYMSKLFGLKGYQVEFTPVANNHGVDLTVEKMGVKIAVGCVLSNKILGEEDVRRVEQGKQYYGASRAMVVTNQYFDRAASAYGKSQTTSLVDRNVLAEDFMR